MAGPGNVNGGGGFIPSWGNKKPAGSPAAPSSADPAKAANDVAQDRWASQTVGAARIQAAASSAPAGLVPDSAFKDARELVKYSDWDIAKTQVFKQTGVNLDNLPTADKVRLANQFAADPVVSHLREQYGS